MGVCCFVRTPLALFAVNLLLLPLFTGLFLTGNVMNSTDNLNTQHRDALSRSVQHCKWLRQRGRGSDSPPCHGLAG
eukprot:2371216-Rhodomonas_salina.2